MNLNSINISSKRNFLNSNSYLNFLGIKLIKVDVPRSKQERKLTFLKFKFRYLGTSLTGKIKAS